MKYTYLLLIFAVIIIMTLKTTDSATPSFGDSRINSAYARPITHAPPSSTSNTTSPLAQRNAFPPLKEALVFCIIGTGLVVWMRKYRVL
jgi:hypothetical protein